MKRAPFIIAGMGFGALFIWQSCLQLVREPSHTRAMIKDDDYPLELGLTWVYKAAGGLQVIRRVDESFMGHGWFLMKYELPILGEKKLLMSRTREGVLAQRGDGLQLIMRFPMRPGDTWTIDFPTEDVAACTVLEPEQIEVLKKRMTASKLQIVRTARRSGKKSTDYEWYVRGIGLARMQVTYGLKATFELERFEKAK